MRRRRSTEARRRCRPASPSGPGRRRLWLARGIGEPAGFASSARGLRLERRRGNHAFVPRDGASFNLSSVSAARHRSVTCGHPSRWRGGWLGAAGTGTARAGERARMGTGSPSCSATFLTHEPLDFACHTTEHQPNTSRLPAAPRCPSESAILACSGGLEGLAGTGCPPRPTLVMKGSGVRVSPSASLAKLFLTDSATQCAASSRKRCCAWVRHAVARSVWPAIASTSARSIRASAASIELSPRWHKRSISESSAPTHARLVQAARRIPEGAGRMV